MKKYVGKITISALSILLAFGLVNCKKVHNPSENNSSTSTNDVVKSEFTISFESNGGSYVNPIVAEKGVSIKEPTSPTREFYVFKGWYGDANLTSKYVFLSMPAQDITLYAKWEAIEAGKIIFDSCGGSEVASIYGNENTEIVMPSEPKREGYDFIGWYEDENYQVKFEDTIFTSEQKVVYAKWELNSNFVEVSYYINETMAYKEVVDKGSQIIIPSSLLSNDLIVENWYSDETFTTKFDLKNQINDNISIYGSIYSKGLKFEGNKVVNYVENSENVVIPVTYNDVKITEISNDSFFKKVNMKTISLPSSIDTINNRAFYGCSYLEKIDFNGTLINVGEYAFYNNTRLENLPVMNINIINKGTFTGCKAITSIEFGNKITSIEEYAFANCSSLTEINIPNTVSKIDNYALSNCVALKEIHLPASLSLIGDGAFINCSGLEYFSIDSNNLNYKIIDGNLYNYLGNSLILYVKGQKTETSFTIPTRVNTIKKGAFSGNNNITNLDISTVKNVEQGALSGMEALEILSVDTIGYSDSTDGNYNFLAYYFGADSGKENGIQNSYVCEKLHTVSIKGVVTQIEDYAFYGINNLSRIEGLENITSIGSYAFAYTALESFRIETDVEYIGEMAFANCDKLAAFRVANGNLNYAASNGYLYNADKTKLILAPNNVTELNVLSTCNTIAKYALASTHIENLIIPENITALEQFSLSNMDQLISLSIPYIGGGSDDTNYMSYLFGTTKSVNDEGQVKFDSVIGIPGSLNTITITGNINKIDEYAFAYFSNVKEINFPETVTEIDRYAFYQCLSITETKLNNNITTIGEMAYGLCIGLKEVVIPGSITSLGISAFQGCLNLSSVIIEEGVKEISEMCFAPYVEASSLGSYSYYSMLSNVVIPSSVETIGQLAFFNSGNYNGKIYPLNISFENIETSKLKTIGAAAFEQSSLVSITLPASVEVIDAEAFAICQQLKQISIGNEKQGSQLQSFGEISVYYCTSLEEVRIYKNVTSAEEVPVIKLFESNGSLYSCFYASQQGFKIYIPEASYEFYATNENWSTYSSQMIVM